MKPALSAPAIASVALVAALAACSRVPPQSAGSSAPSAEQIVAGRQAAFRL